MGEGGKWGFHLNPRSECFGDLRIQQHFGKLKISFQMGIENTNLGFFLEEKMVGIDGIVGRCFSCWGGLNPEAAELGVDLGTYLSHRAQCQILVLEELLWERGLGSYRSWESRKGAAGN